MSGLSKIVPDPSKIVAEVYQYTGSLPPSLPSYGAIIAECQAAYRAAQTVDRTRQLRALRLANGSAFVKFGYYDIEHRAADMQHYVYEFLRTHGRGFVRVPQVYAYVVPPRGTFRYIVMELIEGVPCGATHIRQVARAVEELISIPAPTAAPGPIRPGPIDHYIFDEGTSTVTYDSVLELQTHFNRILAIEGHKDVLDLVDEVRQHGLCLCPSDLDAPNFLIDARGTPVALDFGHAAFLPACFFHHALECGRAYAASLARFIAFPRYPSRERPHVMLLYKVGYIFVVSGGNVYGLPDYLMPERKRDALKLAGAK